MIPTEDTVKAIESVTESVEEAVATMRVASEKIRRLRAALADINDMVEDSVDINNHNGPNLAMRVSMIIKQALED